MTISSISAHEPCLTTAPPRAGYILASNPTSPPLAPSQPTAGSPNVGTIQPNTIFGIVIGLVCFIILILACSFISRLPCFRKPQGVPPTSPRPWSDSYIRREIRRMDLHRFPTRPPIYHVEPPVTPMLTRTGHRAQPSDRDYYLPPYEYPPPYVEAPQRPRSAHTTFREP